MSDYRSGARNTQTNPGLFHARKQESSQRIMNQRDTEANNKLPLAKDESFEPQKNATD